MLALIEPLARGFDHRSFQCKACDFAETVVVNFRLEVSAPALAPPGSPSARVGVLAARQERAQPADSTRALIRNLFAFGPKRQARGGGW